MNINHFLRHAFALSLGIGVSVAAVPAVADAMVITSDWNAANSLDGWTRNGHPTCFISCGDPDTSIGWSSVNGGSVIMREAAEGTYDVLLAPLKFLGNWSSGGTLSFDYWTSFAVAYNPVAIGSSKGVTWSSTGINFAVGWNHVTIDLSSFVGANLNNVTALAIPIDMMSGSETHYVDNVTLTLNEYLSVPEPGAALLMAGGLIGLALLRRRETAVRHA